MKAAIFKITDRCIAVKPLAMIAEPANPPINVCEEEEGIPFHHVRRFHIIAPITPAKMMGRVI